jgi:PAS domain S-box-containing protein
MRLVNLPIARLPIGAVVLCISIIAIVCSAMLYDLDRSEEAAIEQARRDVSNLAIAYREHISRTVGAIDQLLAAIAYEHARRSDEYVIPDWVGRSSLLQGLALQVGLIGPDGIVRATNLDLAGRVDVSDRPHFRHNLDPSASQPYISAPVLGRVSAKWSIQFTRRITLNDGSFGGVALVSVDPFYLSRFIDSIDLGGNASAALIGRDGIVRARRALDNQDLGQDMSGSTLFRNLQVASVGTYIASGKIDATQRIFGYASVSDYPLIVGLGISMDQVLAASRRQREAYLVVGGFATVVIISLTCIFVRESNRRRRQELAIHAQERLQEQKRQLDAALSNMSQGLLMFDASERIVVCNQRYIEMYALSQDIVKPGLAFRELIEHRKVRGTFEGNLDQYHRNVRDTLKQGEISSLVVEVPNERSIRIVNQPMVGGGWVATHEDITEQRKNENALAEARNQAEQAEREANEAHMRLREAFDVVPEGLALFDQEDRYVLWNKRYLELYPETGEDIQVGRTFEDVLRAGLAKGQYPDAAGREAEWLAARLARHAEVQSSHEQRLPGDRWLRVEERRTAAGGSIGVRVDITDLKWREASFRLLFEGNPLPMFVFDVESLAFMAVNDAAVSHYGYSRDQFQALTVLDIRPPEDGDRFKAALPCFDAFYFVEGLRHKKSNGTIFEADIYSRAMTYHGRAARFAAVIDVTDKNTARRALLESEQMARDIISSALDGFSQMDGAGIITEWNPQAAQIFGWSRQEAIGKIIGDLILPKIDRDRHKQGFSRFLQSGEGKMLGKRIDIDALRKDKRKIKVELAVTSFNRRSGWVFNGFVRDLTQKIAAEEQLRQSQKMEAVGNLTGGLAHDFNNLLTVIIGNLDLLMEDMSIDSTTKRQLETVLEVSERGAMLTRQMLAFSRRQPLQAKFVDVNDLIENSCRLLERTLSQNVIVKLRMFPKLWTPLIDASQLETAILNIALNARDAMPKGGTLFIETSNVDIDADHAARFPEMAAGAYVAIEITDTGTGIKPEALSHIFEPFFTTKASGAGTGLGLSMVYGFVKQSGGHITACSEPGIGTTFKMYLPRAGAAEATSLGQCEDLPPSAQLDGHKVILAVDDNPAVRTTVVH